MIARKWLGDKTKGGFYKKNLDGAPARNSGRKEEANVLRWIGRPWNTIPGKKPNSLR